MRRAKGSTGRRRFIQSLLLAFVVIDVAVVAFIGAVVGDREEIVSMYVVAELDDAGNARITEVIDYDFGLADRHGIYRDVPGLTSDARVEVDSPTAPDQFERFPGAVTDTVRIRIGDPDQTVSGQHRYTISYTLEDLLGPAGELDYNGVGDQWTVPIARAEVHVLAPFELAEPECRGAGDCELAEPGPGHLVATAAGLDAGVGVRLVAEVGSSVTRPARPGLPGVPDADDGAGLFLPAAVAAVAARLAMSVTSRVVLRAGRDRSWASPTGRTDLSELAEMVVATEPPLGLTPAQGGILLEEKVSANHQMAWLVDHAVNGHIAILGQDKDDARLSMPDTPTAVPDPLLVGLFGGAGEVSLGAYDRDFAQAWGKVKEDLGNWRHTCGYWVPESRRAATGALVLGILGLAIGLGGVGVAAAWSASGTPVALVAVGAAALVAGTGAAAAIRSRELQVRTEEGAALAAQVEAFRRFLAGSPAPQADWFTAPGVLDRYTAWAVAFGLTDEWADLVSRTVSGRSDLRYNPMLIHQCAYLGSCISSTSTAPSSSGGGGGVGGGGGAGGGGGGSW